MFQSSVASKQAFGVPGELYSNAPTRGMPKTIVSDSDVDNVIGRAVTIPDTANSSVVEMGGTGVYVGILVGPKLYANNGTADGGSLAPTMTLPNNTEVETLQEGELIVFLNSAANEGDTVVFDQDTGMLSAIAPNAEIASGFTNAQATVTRFSIPSAGSAVIALNIIPTQNALAS